LVKDRTDPVTLAIGEANSTDLGQSFRLPNSSAKAYRIGEYRKTRAGLSDSEKRAGDIAG